MVRDGASMGPGRCALAEVPITTPFPSRGRPSRRPAAPLRSCGSLSSVKGNGSNLTLVWSLDGTMRKELLLQLVDTSSFRESLRTMIDLPQAAVSNISGAELGDLVVLALATEDNTVYRIMVDVTQGTAGVGEVQDAGGMRRGLEYDVQTMNAGDLVGPDVRVVSILVLNAALCVGCSNGDIVCLDATTLDPSAAFTLRPSGGLGLPRVSRRDA